MLCMLQINARPIKGNENENQFAPMRGEVNNRPGQIFCLAHDQLKWSFAAHMKGGNVDTIKLLSR